MREENMNIELIAKICHNVNAAYCKAIDDGSQVGWDAAPEWQRESCIAGVKAHLETPRTPEQSHALWMDHKIKDGWKYGPKKDPEKKEHPCMVAYDELPEEQRVKDFLFKAVVDSFK